MEPQNVEDILLNSESAPLPSQEVPMPRGMASMPLLPVVEEPHSRRFLWVVVIAILIIVSGAAGWKVMEIKKTVSKATVSEIPKLLPAPLHSSEPTAPSVIQPLVSQEVAVLDTDNDGLTDAEEKKLGTDLAKADTDNDGLSDFEEAEIWFTSPNSSDTDNDSYLDGDEVSHGYNPKGAGRL